MAFGKKNEVQLDPFKYNIGILGEGGVGKTTVVYEMCQEHLGDDGYLFVECGKEDGADSIMGINYINCPDWNSDYDELNNSVGFSLLVEDIIENKDTEYPNLKVVVIDTFDQLREIVVPEIIRLHNKQHPDKRIMSLKAAFGGYMAGDDMADELMIDKLWELKKVGVHFIAIGHVKTRELTDPTSNDVYTQLTTDMSMRTFNKLKTKLHFLGVASIDREIVKEQRGKKKDANVIKSEARKITFRDDNYAIDSKSRFADIASECPLNAEALYQTLYDAIEKEATKNGGDIKKIKKAQADTDKARAKAASEYSKAAKENKIDEDTNTELLEEIKEKFSNLDTDQVAEVKELMKELGVKNFKNPEETPTKALEQILEKITSFNED